MRRAVITAFLLAVAAAQAPPAASTQQTLSPGGTDNTVRPLIVPSLQAASPAPAAPRVAVAPPLAVDADAATLQRGVEAQQQALVALQRQLEDGYKQKARLQLTQKLMAGVIGLHKAERMLVHIDKKLAESKASLKKFNDQAEEIGYNAKRAEADRAKEAAERERRLSELRSALGLQEKAVQELASKRDGVVTAVTKWKEHVEQLRALHETLASGAAAGVPPEAISLPPPILDLPLSYPAPPPPVSHLSLHSEAEYLPPYRPGSHAEYLPPSLQTPALNKMLDSNSDLAPQAISEVMKAALRNLGVASRFADDADAGAGRAAGSVLRGFAAAEEDAEGAE